MWLLTATNPTGDPLFDWITQGGAIGVLAFIVIAFIRGWIVTGGALSREREEKNRALDLVYKQAEMTQRALDVAEQRRGQ